MSGDTVASAAVRRRQRRSILKITLTSASKTLHDQFHLIHRHQTRLRGCRCDRLSLLRDGLAVSVDGEFDRPLLGEHARLGEFDVDPVDVISDVQVVCEDCGRQYGAVKLVERGACEYKRPDAEGK